MTYIDQFRAWVLLSPTGSCTVVIDAYSEERARQCIEDEFGQGCIIFMARRKPEFVEAERRRERELEQEQAAKS